MVRLVLNQPIWSSPLVNLEQCPYSTKSGSHDLIVLQQKLCFYAPGSIILDWFVLGVKRVGASPVEAGLFLASTSEETPEKEDTGSHGQRRQGLGGGEEHGRHLLPPLSASGLPRPWLAIVSWWTCVCADPSLGHDAHGITRRLSIRGTSVCRGGQR
jgi:hypothetical protein